MIEIGTELIYLEGYDRENQKRIPTIPNIGNFHGAHLLRPDQGRPFEEQLGAVNEEVERVLDNGHTVFVAGVCYNGIDAGPLAIAVLAQNPNVSRVTTFGSNFQYESEKYAEGLQWLEDHAADLNPQTRWKITSVAVVGETRIPAPGSIFEGSHSIKVVDKGNEGNDAIVNQLVKIPIGRYFNRR